MAKTNRKLFDEEIEPSRHLVGEISYSKGGANYFSGGTEKRGYWFLVRAETVKDGFRSFVLLNGGAKVFLKEAARFSAKELEKIEPTPEQVAELKARVLADPDKAWGPR